MGATKGVGSGLPHVRRGPPDGAAPRRTGPDPRPTDPRPTDNSHHPVERHEGPAPARGPGLRRTAVSGWTQALGASSSTATFFTRLGSTWMPGPIVVETVIFLM